MKSFFNHQFWTGLVAGVIATGFLVLISHLFFPSQEEIDRKTDEAYMKQMIGEPIKVKGEIK